ncbi:MAG TPA: GldG family protein, partial [Gemmatimonadales bacterium]|nr:GldG family protein [Gemmatimonadales bacterium]
MEVSVEGPGRRKVIEGSILGAGVALVAALVLIVNYFGWKYYQRFDWTGSKIYSLSEKSQGVVAGLDQDVEALVFMSPNEELYTPVRELLARYEAASPRIRVRQVDPEKNLIESEQIVKKYQLASAKVVVFEAGEARRVIEAGDLAEYDYSGMQMGEGPRMTGFKGEQRFTGALLELQEDRKPKILFTTGHGERSLDAFEGNSLSMAQDLLGRDNFEIEAWASLGQSAVPPGTDLLVIAGPTAGFVAPELEAFAAYLAGGGRILALVDPTLPAGAGGLADTGLRGWLAGFGVELGDDIVVDPSNPLPFFGPETIFSASYGDHAITRSLRDRQEPAIFPLARSVAKGTVPAGLEATELVRTSDQGWGETNLADLQAVKKDPDDRSGPVSIAVAVAPVEVEADAAAGEAGEEESVEEESLEEKPADPGAGPAPEASAGATTGAAAPATPAEPAAPRLRLVVIGDSDFATNAQLANAGNPTLLANTVNWLVERQQALGIPP